MLKTITPIDNSILVERNYSSNNEIETTLENAKTALRLWKNTPLKIINIFVKILKSIKLKNR